MCKINFKKVEPLSLAGTKPQEIPPEVSNQNGKLMQYANFTDFDSQKSEYLPLLPFQIVSEQEEIERIEEELKFPTHLNDQLIPLDYYQDSHIAAIPIPPYTPSNEGFNSPTLSLSLSEDNSSPPYQPSPQITQPNVVKQNYQFISTNITPESFKKRAPPPNQPVPQKKKVKTEIVTQTQVTTTNQLPKSNKTNTKITDDKRERNRLAAEKYRKKGRDTISSLESICNQLSSENSQLKDKSAMLEQQVQQLKTVLFQYGVSQEALDVLAASLS